MPDEERVSPYLFAVEIDGIEAARFHKCEGLEAEAHIYEIEEGGHNMSTHKFYGRVRFPNLILEKGVSENNALFNWFKETVMENRPVERKNGSIVLKKLDNTEIKRWNFFRALPCRWSGPRLEGSPGRVFAVERIEIAHEGLTLDSD